MLFFSLFCNCFMIEILVFLRFSIHSNITNNKVELRFYLLIIFRVPNKGALGHISVSQFINCIYSVTQLIAEKGKYWIKVFYRKTTKHFIFSFILLCSYYTLQDPFLIISQLLHLLKHRTISLISDSFITAFFLFGNREYLYLL